MQTLQNPNFNFKKTETNIKQINKQAAKENNRQLVSYRDVSAAMFKQVLN